MAQDQRDSGGQPGLQKSTQFFAGGLASIPGAPAERERIVEWHGPLPHPTRVDGQLTARPGTAFVMEGFASPLLIRGLLGRGGAGRVFEVNTLLDAVASGMLPQVIGEALAAVRMEPGLWELWTPSEFADVLKVNQLRLPSRALKIVAVSPDDPCYGVVVARTNKEYRFLGQVGDDPALPTPIHFGERPWPHLLTNCFHGQTLAELFSATGRWHKGGRLSLEFCMRVLIRTAETVTRLHGAGIVHRDLKPENIFVRFFHGGKTFSAALLDLGLAGELAWPGDPARERLTARLGGTVGGTLGYMPLEQWVSGADVREGADVFALGMILRELLEGERLYHTLEAGAYYQLLLHELPPVACSVLPSAVVGEFHKLIAAMCKQAASERLSLAEAIAQLKALEPDVRGK